MTLDGVSKVFLGTSYFLGFMKIQNSLRVASVAIFFLLFFTTAANAQFRCTDIFARAETPALGSHVKVTHGGSAMIPPIVAESIAELRGAILNMRSAKTQRDFNDHQYSLVLAGNNILNIIVQNTLRARHPQISPEQANNVNQVSMILARQLMKAFEVPPEVLAHVIYIRVEALAAELNALSQAAQERRPIGFIAPRADNSAKDLNLEAFTNMIRKILEPRTAFPDEKKTIGFTNQRSRSEAEQDAATPKEPIGFVRPQRSTDDTETSERAPMGFVRSSREKEDSLEMHYQIILNIERGHFDRMRLQE